ncbi:MAG: DUF3817 domain-containing protein [Flavobacteriaceae bacterium]
MLKLFRITAILEGLSYLALFGFSMPLKYWAGLPQYNIYIGYAHGFLFLAYIGLAIAFFVEKNQSWGQLTRLILASLLPFGTFYIEERYLRNSE